MTFSPTILDRINRSRVVAGFAIDQVEHAVPLAGALLEGGIDAIELMLRTPNAIESVQAICESVPEMLVGVGTILTPEAAEQAQACGADFGVAPGLNRRVVQTAQRVGLPFAPGIATPSDLEAAIELDCRFVKFFPAEPSGGLKYLRSLAAPYKHLGIQYFPLGGINAENMLSYLDEPNVLAVGGSWIVAQDLVQNQDWNAIRQRAIDVTDRIKASSAV